MNSRRELSLGLLAALVSLIIIAGSFITSLAEGKISIAQLPRVITSSPFPTIKLVTQKPGEPSLTPSLIPPPTEQETSVSSPACSIPPGWMKITINPGDSLESLAATYNVSVDELRNGNCLYIDKLIPGTFLYVPALPASPSPTPSPTQRPPTPACEHPWGWILYTVQPGDTLYSLATRVFRITLEQLMHANCMYSDKIRAGEQIWVPNVPTSTPVPSTTPTNTPSSTPSITPPQPTTTNTSTPTPTFTPTMTLSPTVSTPTLTPTSTPTNTATSVPTDTPTSPPYP